MFLIQADRTVSIDMAVFADARSTSGASRQQHTLSSLTESGSLKCHSLCHGAALTATYLRSRSDAITASAR